MIGLPGREFVTVEFKSDVMSALKRDMAARNDTGTRPFSGAKPSRGRG
jgi:hypothetical protein